MGVRVLLCGLGMAWGRSHGGSAWPLARLPPAVRGQQGEGRRILTVDVGFGSGCGRQIGEEVWLRLEMDEIRLILGYNLRVWLRIRIYNIVWVNRYWVYGK